ncbi:glycosyltransferase family 4 protein [Winogradskyella alexanderae]|uniref:Glycosyltransferase family 4 protein n=1 Tax=Winogradskyella alexanderae TaxID=2877123 RepID=A0ABS7XMQ8_9FLAO|nr:glycosyltransferase family 4 protein [Winogradskyella alexanderae]MCA0131300.1 glycosyltransferase family 4 protein [Winogradskyella alexanderae]
MEQQKIRVLFIGNKTSNNNKSIGGANTYTEALHFHLSNNEEIEVYFLEIRKRWYKGGQILDYITFPFKFLSVFHKFDVISIHATWDFHITLGPLLVLISKLFKKKIIYHFFGGQFHKLYNSFPSLLRKWLDKTILASNFKLMETKRMIRFFSDLNFKNFVWFPNSRMPQSVNLSLKEYSKKFVFISRVSPTKGINEIINVAGRLDSSFTIDIYGPLDQSYNRDSFAEANYRGVLKPEDVVATLRKYDVLLLPTFHDGEGYPGIFIEAMSIGMPIITTKWNALDELVEDNFNGKLIKPKSADELYDAILSINQSNFKKYLNNALEKFDEFNIELVVAQLVKLYKS